MITNKLFNFPKIIFENIFSSANRVWIELISNLFLVLIAAIITIAIILYKQRKALKKIDVLSKIENELSNNFLNELPVYFVALNADGTTRYMNRTMLNSLGYQEKDVLQKDYFQLFIPSGERELLKGKFFNLSKKDNPSYNENIVLTKEGKKLWVKWYLQPVYNSFGEFEFYNSIGIDLTAERRAKLEVENLFIPKNEQINLSTVKEKITAGLFFEKSFSLKLKQVLKLLPRILPNDGSDIALLENSHLRVIAIDGYKGRYVQKIVRNLNTDINNFPLEKEVIEKQKLVVIPDTYQDSRWRIIPGLEWIHSCIKVPIVIEGKILGTMGIASETRNTFDQTSIKKIESFIYGFTASIYNYLNYYQLLKSRDDIIHAVTKLVETRDPYTVGHQENVARIATSIAREMGLKEDMVETIRIASLVHDIGKFNIPSEILNKPSRLNDIEYSLVKNHSQLGYDILKDISFTTPIAEIVYQHHEKFDGSGYPRALKGEEILLEARIICVADVFEAMASHRPYRQNLGIEAAEEELKKNKGILYDPQVVDACLRIKEKTKALFNH
ncbi:MAG TPA: HD domain-containing protein [Atribacterota bacterium]|nr:HD domain-containing protein [Atribacterota bacterium]